MGETIANLIVKITADASGVKQGLGQARQEINSFGGNAKGGATASGVVAGQALGAGIGTGAKGTVKQGVGKAIDDVVPDAPKKGAPIGKGLGRGILGGLAPSLAAGGGMIAAGAAAATVGVAALGAGITLSTKKAIDFGRGMGEVYTLLPDASAEAREKMMNDLLAFDAQMGVTSDKSVPALYQAISSGVPADNVFDFLTIAQKAAVGGVTDLETSVDGITSVINAYGTDVLSATQASDLMFMAAKDGKTDFEQLSRSLYNVVPTAAANGVAFGDVTAALAAMTAQGTPTSVATTQLRQMLVELTKDGSKTAAKFEQIAGKSFKEFIAEGGNVSEALQLMDDYAKSNGKSIADMFSSVEAGAATLQLTGKGAETFNQFIRDMETSAGATEKAFSEMEKTSGRALDRLAGQFDSLVITIGQAFEPLVGIIADALGGAMPIIQEFATGFRDVMQGAIDFVKGLFAGDGGDLFAPLAESAKKQMDFLKHAFDELGALGPYLAQAFDAIKNAMQPLLPVFAAVLAAIQDFATLIKTLMFDSLIASIKIVCQLISGDFAGAFKTAEDASSTAFQNIAQYVNGPLENVKQAVINFVKQIPQQFASMGAGIKTAVQGALAALPGVMKAGAEKALQALGTAIRVGVTGLKDAWKGLSEGAAAGFEELKTYVGTAFEGIKSALGDGIKNALDGLSDAWEGLTEGASDAFDAVCDVVESGIETIQDLLSGKLKVEDLFKGLIDAGKKAWDDLVNGAKDVGGKVVDAIVKSIKAEVTKLIDIGKWAWENLSKGLFGESGGEGPEKTGKEVGEKLDEGIKTGVEDKKEVVVKAVEDTLDKPKEKAEPKGKETGEKFGTGVKTGVESKSDEVVAAVDGVLDEAGDKAGEKGAAAGKSYAQEFAAQIAAGEMPATIPNVNSGDYTHGGKIYKDGNVYDQKTGKLLTSPETAQAEYDKTGKIPPGYSGVKDGKLIPNTRGLSAEDQAAIEKGGGSSSSDTLTVAARSAAESADRIDGILKQRANDQGKTYAEYIAGLEKEGQLNKAIQDAMKSLDEGYGGEVAPVIRDVRAEIGLLEEGTQKWDYSTKAAVETMKAELPSTYDGVLDGLTKMGEAQQINHDQAMYFMDDLKKGSEGAVQPLIDGINEVQTGVKMTGDQTSKFLQDVMMGQQGLFEPARQELQSLMTQNNATSENVMNAYEKWKKGGSTAFDPAFTSLKKVGDQIGLTDTQMKAFVQYAASSSGNAIEPMIQDFVTLAQKMGLNQQQAQQMFNALLQGTNMSSAQAQKLQQAFATAFNKMGSDAQSAASKTNSALGSIQFSKAGQIRSAFENAFMSMAQRASSSCRQITSEINAIPSVKTVTINIVKNQAFDPAAFAMQPGSGFKFASGGLLASGIGLVGEAGPEFIARGKSADVAMPLPYVSEVISKLIESTGIFQGIMGLANSGAGAASDTTIINNEGMFNGASFSLNSESDIDRLAKRVSTLIGEQTETAKRRKGYGI